MFYSTPLAKKVIGCAIEVHRTMGPGLLESAYADCLAHELTLHRLEFARDTELPLFYKGVKLQCHYRIDFLIERLLLLELKAVDYLLPVHTAQVITYLTLLNIRQGLLINFNVPQLVSGLKSVLC